MNLAVLGTGMVAKAIAGKLAALGHSVKMGTRDVAATLQRNESDMAGGPPLRSWLEANPKVQLGTLAEAAAHGAIVWSALAGQGALPGLELAGADRLAGKILIDLSNPLDFSRGMPPSLTVCNTDSLGEQIQRALPRTKVVKTLNTVNCFLMVEPGQLAGGDHTMLLAGSDGAAKAEVTKILKEWLGWKDVVDVGDITAARAMEMWLPLWTRLFAALGTVNFNFKLVR
jgi:predicted dinucleotide-binding enzyme